MKKIEIAVAVLKRAADYDTRIHVEDSKALAWARLFENQKVWMTEALAAVDLHYSKPNAFAIMPGDVIGYCSTCPVYSSRDHASEFLAFWCRHPYSDAIEAQSGIQPPTIEAPESLRGEERKQHLIEKLTDWVAQNHDRLVDAIMERQWNPVVE